MSADLEQLIKQYSDQLVQYSKAHPQPTPKKEQEVTPATPYTAPTIPPVQTPEMPLILPGEPLDAPAAPITEPPATLPPLKGDDAQAPYISSDIADVGDDEGYLQIRAYTADKALPVEGALVVITTPEGALVASMITDRDGLTSAVALKTTARSESLMPDGADSYDTYNVKVMKDGFLDFINDGVPVFGGITNLQGASMIPLPEFGNSDN